MELDFKKLNRFTTIPFLIDLLKRQKLSLLNPAFWEDYNDRATVEIYREKMKKQSIYALCLTQNETIHHWNAFANGTSGCCIEFSPESLFSILKDVKEVSHGKAAYIRMQDLSLQKIQTSQLPFVKRAPFRPENEYRLIAISDEEQRATFDIDISLNIIRRVTINNKIPDVVFKSIKEALLQLAPELNKKIFHSTLYNNTTWINHFKK